MNVGLSRYVPAIVVVYVLPQPWPGLPPALEISSPPISPKTGGLSML